MIIEILWVCPECGTPNADDYAQTTFPACSNDDRHKQPQAFYWSEILNADDLAKANQALIAQEQEQTE